MFLRVIVVFCFVSWFGPVYGQQEDFCDAVMTISRDAPNDFRNIKGRQLQKDFGLAIWAAGIKVPGGITARFVSSMGLFYECAFSQSKKKEEVGPAYERYKQLLSDCLLQQGYELTQQPNFYPGLADYKKLVFMPQIKDDTNTKGAPSHVTLEATYNKDIGLYTLVLYIFQH